MIDVLAGCGCIAFVTQGALVRVPRSEAEMVLMCRRSVVPYYFPGYPVHGGPNNSPGSCPAGERGRKFGAFVAIVCGVDWETLGCGD